MANLVASTFEGGTSGTDVTAANSGGTSGTAFNFVEKGTGATVAYDSTRFAHGTKSLKLQTGSTVAGAAVEWSAALGPHATTWGRLYVYLTVRSPEPHRILTAVTEGYGSLCSAFYLTPTGTIDALNAGGGTAVSTTSPITLNAWNRIEWKIIGHASTGQIEVSVFNTMDSTTATQTVSTAATVNTGGPVAICSFGSGYDGRANTGPLWLDDIAASATGPLGPAVTSSMESGRWFEFF